MAGWFVIGWLLFICLAFFVTYWKSASIRLNPILIFLCFLPLLGTEPLFENDHYRYLWEGKVLSEGLNPWRVAPSSELLDKIDFPERELIGFNKLTSPYSPLAVVYHSLFSLLTYSHGLLALQIFNAVLSAGVFFFIPPLKPIYAIGIAGLLGKEFVQSVHIDLLVWLFLWLALVKIKKKSYKISAFSFLISSLLKVNILLMIPWFICTAFRNQRYRGLYIWFLVLFLSLLGNLMGPLSLHQGSGLKAFMEHWVWHSGFIAFWQIFGGSISSGINIANIFWVCGIACLGIMCIKKQYEGMKWSTLLYTFTAVCRPAFNSWYFPWFGLAAAFAGQELVLIYALASPLAYIKYAEPANWLFILAVFVTHAPAIIYLSRQINLYPSNLFTKQK